MEKITKTELDERINEISRKFDYISKELESLWQEATKQGLWNFSDRISHIQFSSFANPDNFTLTGYGAVSCEFRMFYDILKENEELRRISKVSPEDYMKLENKLKSISNIINNK